MCAIKSELYKSAIKWFLTAAAVFWVQLVPITAQAYVPEVPQLVDLMARALAGPKRLRVVQQVSENPAPLPETHQPLLPEGTLTPGQGIQAAASGTQRPDGWQAPLNWTETLSFIFPYRFRRDAWVGDINLVDVINGPGRLRVKSGIIQPWQKEPLDAWLVPLLYRDRLLLLEKLARQGIDLSTSSLGRWDHGLVYVIGDQFPRRSSVQLWIGKQDFLPVRWILPVTEKGPAEGREPEAFEIRYLDWTRQGETWYPGRIEFYRGQRLLRSCRVMEILPEADFSDFLFDLGYLKTIYSLPLPEPKAESRDQGLDEVQQTIDSFHQKFRD